MQELSLRECSRVSDEAVAAVAAHGSLEALDVSALPEIGPATIKALATCCKCVAAHLSIVFCQSAWLTQASCMQLQSCARAHCYSGVMGMSSCLCCFRLWFVP